MSIDDRLRERVQRSMSGIDIGAEDRLDDALHRGRQRRMTRRTFAGVAVIVSIAVVVVAAPRVLGLEARNRQPASTPSSIQGVAPGAILGTWRRDYTCQEFVREFERAGIGELAARWLVNIGLQEGPVRQLATSANMCRGAKHFQRTHVFEPNGYLNTYQGDKLADQCRCYRLVGDHTFVAPANRGSGPDATLQYWVDGETLTFSAVIPDQCSSPRCRGHFAWALANYAVGTWHRVN